MPNVFAGPQALLAHLARYTHRVAIANCRLVALDDKSVSFHWKDYRARGRVSGHGWVKKARGSGPARLGYGSRAKPNRPRPSAA